VVNKGLLIYYLRTIVKRSKSICQFTYSIKLMKLIRFLKPDLKRIIFLLIILSPFLIFHLPLPAQFYLWDYYIFLWANVIAIPFLIVSMIFFGGFDVGGGLFPYSNISDIVTYSIGILFCILFHV
jgi:hypothetical protein